MITDDLREAVKRAIYAARFVVIDKLFNELGDEALAIQSR
jgi:hypothetical protein